MTGKEPTLPSTIRVGGIEFKIVLKKMKDYGVCHAALAISGLSDVLNDDNVEEALVRVADYILFPVYKREYGNYRRRNNKEV